MSGPVNHAAFRAGTFAGGVLNRNEAPWSAKEKEYAARSFEAGLTYSEIADDLGRSRSAVAGKIRRMRESRDGLRVAPALSHSQAAKSSGAKHLRRVADLLADGLELADIAVELGTTRKVIDASFRKICGQLGRHAR